MNESVVDILIYLYENYMDAEQSPPSDENELQQELAQAGFRDSEIQKAFRWLNTLALRQSAQDYRHHTAHSLRVFTDQEARRLDANCRGFLLNLEQNGILDQINRELVIEQALALDSLHISVDELKWIVLLVLMNQPGQEAAFARMEDMVYNDTPIFFH